MMRNGEPAKRRRPAATARACALILLVVGALTITTIPSASAARASGPATTASTTAGFPPRWAIDVDDAFGTDDQRGFAVDRLGNSYSATGRTLLRMFSPGGSPLRSIEAQGAGSIAAWGLTVSDDLDVTVVGYLEGSVTIGTPPDQVPLTGADSNTQFMIQFDRDGAVSWSRTFGGGNDGTIRPLQLHQEGDVVLLNGQYEDSIEIDGIALDQPHQDDWNRSGLLAGFDGTTGEARWLTGIDLIGSNANSAQILPLDGATDDDSFAVVGFAGGDVQVRGADVTTDAACDEFVAGGCELLVVVDPATGNPALARALVAPADTLTLDNVALIEDGFVVAGIRYDTPTATWGGSFVDRLDATGDQVWSKAIVGKAPINGLEVDGNGDIVVSGGFEGTVTLGDEIGAPSTTATSSSNMLLVELDGDGAVQRWTTAGGAGSAQAATTRPGLAIGPDDEIVVTGTHFLDITFGSGPGAVTVPGLGTFLASYAADRPPPGSTFHPITPTRLLDSRTATGGWNGPLVAGSPRELTVAGTLGLPADATAVVLNVTATDVSAMTYLTAWPTGLQQPTASNLNIVAGDTISNHVTVQVGADGTISLATAQGTTNVVADLYGYFTTGETGDGYHTLTPTRLLDSRTPTGGWNAELAAGTPRDLQVTGSAGIPSNATAVVLSVTVTDTSDLTYLRVQPTGRTASNSNLAVNRGQTITNLVTTAVDSGGKLTFTNNTGTINVVADAVGYYDHAGGGATFHPVSPTRILDSRTGTGSPASPWGPGTTRAITTTAIAPAGTITAVAANLTATDTTAMSLTTLFPQAPRPATSNLLFTAGQTIASAANTGVAPDGTVSLYNQLGTAHLILDIDGYFTAP